MPQTRIATQAAPHAISPAIAGPRSGQAKRTWTPSARTRTVAVASATTQTRNALSNTTIGRYEAISS